MNQILDNLTRIIQSGTAWAILAAGLWGILSVLLSPCHLAGIPLIVGYLSGRNEKRPVDALGISILFALGILITLAIIGLITAAAGRIMGDVGPLFNYLSAGVFFLVGLHLMGMIPFPGVSPGQSLLAQKGYLSAFVLGLVFGTTLGPCSFAFMAPILAISLKTATERPFYAFLLPGVFGLGHCAVLVLAGTGSQWVRQYLNWNERSRALTRFRKTCGGAIVLAGFYLILTAR